MSVYIYKECPPPNHGRGTKKTSSCGSNETTQTQFTEIARWLRDMGDQITVSGGLTNYSNTTRGPYYFNSTFNATCYASTSAGLCDFGNRYFQGEGGTASTKFTPCNCNRPRCWGFLCPDGDNGTWSNLTINVHLRSWVYDVGTPGGLDGPNYSSEVHWTFPRVCISFGGCSGLCRISPRQFCTEFCYNNPITIYGYASGNGGSVRGNWSFTGSQFTFQLNWNWHNDGQWPCGYCANCPCEKGHGPYSILSRGSVSMQISKGPKSSLRCEV
jgi:hypothetical protein